MSTPIDREEDLFLQALNLSAAERTAFLDEGCGSDAHLRARLDELLFAHEQSVGPLDKRPLCDEPHETANCFASAAPGVLVAGRYKLLEEIGEGGMGTVWVAEQTEPVRRKVALKLVKPGMDSRQFIARFNAERQALALMEHPNIAKVFDGGLTEHGRPYFVMEYVKGVPLTEYCDQAKLPLRERLTLFVQVCQAVQHAHQKGIIHRDLKPSNILACLYDGKPVPKVIDFGLAKAMHQPLTDQTLHTAHGMMLGTPLYMSPEQAEFNNLDVDTRTDIYSLGVILYELLTGTTPLEKQQLKTAAYNEILRLIKEVDPPKPSTRLSGSATLPSIAAQRNLEPHQLRRNVRGELDWIVMKALDKERSRRYETANGLARDIERFLNEEPVEACPPSFSYRIRKFARKHSVVLAAIASFAIVLLSSTVISLCLANRASKAQRKAEFESERALAAEKLAQDAREQAVDQTENAEQNLYRAEMVLAWDAYQNGNIAEAQRLIENHRNWPQRGIEWKILNCELESFGKPWAQLGYGMARKIEVSGDSRVLAVSSANSFSILDDQGKKIFSRLELWEPEDSITAPTPTAISFDGRLVAFKPGTTDPFSILNLMTGLEEQLPQNYANFTSLAFSPTNASIVAVANAEEVRLFDWSQQKLVQSWNRNGRRAEKSRWHSREVFQNNRNELRFSQDGTRLAVYGFPNLEVWNCNSGNLLLARQNDYALHDVDFSPNGKLIAACHHLAPYDVWVGEVSTGRTVASLHGHTRTVHALRFLDDQTLVSSGRDHTIRTWDIQNQRELKSLYGHSHYIRSIARSHNSQEIFTCDEHGEIRKWDLATVSANRQFAARYHDQICDVVTTSDGSKLVAAQLRHKEIQVWDLMSGRHIEGLTFDDPVARVAISNRDFLAVSGKSSVVIYDLASKKKLELGTGLSRGGVIDFSSDGRYLAAKEEKAGLIVWDLQNLDWTSDTQKVPNVVVPEILQSVTNLHWSPHGPQLAVVGSKGLFLWNVGETSAIQLSNTPRQKVAWSNNGNSLACATPDGKIGVFDIQFGLERRLTNVQAAYTWRIAFSPDDSAIITTSGDHSVYIWDARDGMLRARLPGHVDGAMSLLITPDKKRLITGGLYDGRIRVWNIE